MFLGATLKNSQCHNLAIGRAYKESCTLCSTPPANRDLPETVNGRFIPTIMPGITDKFSSRHPGPRPGKKRKLCTITLSTEKAWWLSPTWTESMSTPYFSISLQFGMSRTRRTHQDKTEKIQRSKTWNHAAPVKCVFLVYFQPCSVQYAHVAGNWVVFSTPLLGR